MPAKIRAKRHLKRSEDREASIVPESIKYIENRKMPAYIKYMIPRVEPYRKP